MATEVYIIDQIKALLDELADRFKINPKCLSQEDFERLMKLQETLGHAVEIIFQANQTVDEDIIDLLQQLKAAGVEDIVRNDDLKSVKSGIPGSEEEQSVNLVKDDDHTEIRIKSIDNIPMVGDITNHNVPLKKLTTVNENYEQYVVSLTGEGEIEFPKICGHRILDTSDELYCDSINGEPVIKDGNHVTYNYILPETFITVTFVKEGVGEICHVTIPEHSSVLQYPELKEEEVDENFDWDTPLTNLRNLTEDTEVTYYDTREL